MVINSVSRSALYSLPLNVQVALPADHSNKTFITWGDSRLLIRNLLDNEPKPLLGEKPLVSGKTQSGNFISTAIVPAGLGTGSQKELYFVHCICEAIHVVFKGPPPPELQRPPHLCQSVTNLPPGLLKGLSEYKQLLPRTELR